MTSWDVPPLLTVLNEIIVPPIVIPIKDCSYKGGTSQMTSLKRLTCREVASAVLWGLSGDGRPPKPLTEPPMGFESAGQGGRVA